VTPGLQGPDALAQLFDDFDYGVETDDFLLYELSRLIGEDRASFEDEEFRRIIDEGIRYHVEENLAFRSGMAIRLRGSLHSFDDATRRLARRSIGALEDVESPLHNVSLIVRTYTAYMFRRLEDAAEQSITLEDEARSLIERWQTGEILREQMTTLMKGIGRPAVGPLADLLFDAPEDRVAAETAIDILGAIRCSSSARVLAHAILEPVLEEDLEQKAYQHVRSMWPLPRPYILYTLAPHTHEDLSFRWYQLLIDGEELAAVDMILDELLVHATDPTYHEDIKALLELLRLSRDPEVESKVVGVLNTHEIPADASQILQGFLATFRPAASASSDNPWAAASRLRNLNKKYLAAAKFYDSGRPDEAKRALNSILQVDPEYPFALELSRTSQ